MLRDIRSPTHIMDCSIVHHPWNPSYLENHLLRCERNWDKIDSERRDQKECRARHMNSEPIKRSYQATYGRYRPAKRRPFICVNHSRVSFIQGAWNCSSVLGSNLSSCNRRQGVLRYAMRMFPCLLPYSC